MSFDRTITLPVNREWLQVQCLELRREGKSFNEIASELNLTERVVRTHLSNALAAVTSPLVAELRAVELSRLEEVHRSLWPLVKGANPNLRAIDRFLSVSKARRELMGLDRPLGENDDTGPSRTIIEIFPEDVVAPAGALSPSSDDVASQDESDRVGGWDGSGKDLAGAEVAVR